MESEELTRFCTAVELLVFGHVHYQHHSLWFGRRQLQRLRP